jgi:hypothetical protein
MSSILLALPGDERAAAVVAYDKRFGKMDGAMWCLSRHSRPALLAGKPSPVLQALVSKIRRSWGLRWRPDSSAQIAAALCQMPWTPEVFDPAAITASGAAEAYDRVRALVDGTRALGVRDREYSWSSKVLHWLLPWRIPVFDQYVRQLAGVSGSKDLPAQYRGVSQKVFAQAQATDASDPMLLASLQPQSPLRVIDKCWWWLGGGNTGTAWVDPDPWRDVRNLGLDPEA